MARTTSATGLNLIKEFEGYRSTAYQDSVGVWTIGWGTTRVNGKAVTKGMTCTQTQATTWLKNDIAAFEKNVNSFDGTYKWTQNEFDALVSFAYNIGSINQLTANGIRSKATIASKMLEYVNAGGVKLAGLVRRREAERKLFLTNSSATNNTSSSNTNTSTTDKTTVNYVQRWLNATYSVGLAVDNIYGAKTKSGLVTALQTELNKQFKVGLKVDGIFGSATKAACVNVKNGASGNITKIIQCTLICNGYSLTADGVFGSATETALRSFQKSKSISVDGTAGKNTFAALLQ